MTVNLSNVPLVTEGLHDDAEANGYNYAKQLDVPIRNPIVTSRLCTALAYQQLIEACQESIYDVVCEARTYGATWKDIGDFFGVSPRRAMELYNPSTIASRRATALKRAKKQHELKKEK